ncbi:MAG: hypothetical protein V4629_04425, partial [Pseudomonadota bacterium]
MGFFSSLREVCSNYTNLSSNHLSKIKPSNYFSFSNTFGISERFGIDDKIDQTAKIFLGVAGLACAAKGAYFVCENNFVTNLINAIATVGSFSAGAITTVGSFSIGATAISLGLGYSLHKLGFNHPAELVTNLLKNNIVPKLTFASIAKLLDSIGPVLFEHYPVNQSPQIKSEFLITKASTSIQSLAHHVVPNYNVQNSHAVNTGHLVSYLSSKMIPDFPIAGTPQQKLESLLKAILNLVNANASPFILGYRPENSFEVNMGHIASYLGSSFVPNFQIADTPQQKLESVLKATLNLVNANANRFIPGYRPENSFEVNVGYVVSYALSGLITDFPRNASAQVQADKVLKTILNFLSTNG